MGTIFSLAKLKKRSIYCINPEKIKSSGRVSIMVFDKTGTLTECGLNVSCFKVHDGKEPTGKGNFMNIPEIPFSEPVIKESKIWLDRKTYQEHKDDNLVKYAECKASCHSISLLKDEFLGDTLDIEMFKTSGWVLKDDLEGVFGEAELSKTSIYPKAVADVLNSNQENHNHLYKIKTAFKFDFSSELQRMSTIVKPSYDDKYILFVKGSPEKIGELSRPDTLPSDYEDTYNKYTARGNRVIAMGYRYMVDFDPKSAETLVRSEVEKDIVFLGLLIMVNELKPATTKAISDLKEGGVLPIMATGDNVLTGINKSYKCGIVEPGSLILASFDDKSGRIKWTHRENDAVDGDNNGVVEDGNESDDGLMSSEKRLKDDSNMLPYLMESKNNSIQIAMEGTALQKLICKRNDHLHIQNYKADDVVRKVLEHGKVYARMSPKQKSLLVEELQKETGEMIGMCGDGANDCAALKSADVGLSLSEAEASIVAPFTSKIQDISS
jgi:cation-transporting ATPase 13A2